MNISNLDHIQTINNEAQELVGGSYYRSDYYSINASSYVHGNSAFATANAGAYGYDSFSSTYTNTYTDDYYSNSSSSSASATGSYYYY
jgi:hypothetical protein